MQKMPRIHPLRTLKGFGEIPEDFSKILPDDNQKGSGDSQEAQDKESKIQRRNIRMEQMEDDL